jgi:ribosomal protein S18 acetylase RimI-like enzyme
MVKIREAREEELLKVGRLWGKFMAFNAEFNSSFRVRKKAPEIFSKEMIEKIQDSDCRLAVAEIDGELAGFCYSYVSRKPKYFKLEKFGFVGDLYVEPGYRRQGVGRMLVNDTLAFFSRRKVRQVELLVAIKNTGTIKFWESLGFSHLLTWMYKRT